MAGLIPIKILHPGAQAPARAHPSDAGWDCATPMPVTLPSGVVTKVGLGFALELPPHCFVQIASRSGLASRGIWVVGGVVDPGYRGELVALLYNSTPEPVRFECGDRVCQLLFLPAAAALHGFAEVAMLEPSPRGASGLGSSGLASSKPSASPIILATK